MSVRRHALVFSVLALVSFSAFAEVSKAARIRPGTIALEISKMTVSSAPSDSSVKIAFAEAASKMDGERVFPTVLGRLKLVNAAPSSASQISVSTGDGVLGDLTLDGMYVLYRKSSTLYARFVGDIINKLDHPVEVGTLSEQGEVTLNKGMRFAARIVQHSAASLGRWMENDWDNERIQVYIDGLRTELHKRYPQKLEIAPSPIELKR